jgi:hypothetical protein
MNKDDWLLTFSSLLYVMQPPSVYFDILGIIGYFQEEVSDMEWTSEIDV